MEPAGAGRALRCQPGTIAVFGTDARRRRHFSTNVDDDSTTSGTRRDPDAAGFSGSAAESRIYPDGARRGAARPGQGAHRVDPQRVARDRKISAGIRSKNWAVIASVATRPEASAVEARTNRRASRGGTMDGFAPLVMAAMSDARPETLVAAGQK